MHILVLNWRDMKHPRKGGAEVLTHGIFKRLVELGHRVTWFSSDFPGAQQREVLDGMEIVRGGNAVTVRAHAYRYYNSVRDFDVVVDEINTLPFFAPLFAQCPVVAFICQLARDVWFYEAPAVAAQLGYAIEPLYLRPYREVPTMTISQSSEDSLREEARFKGQIGVMPMAIDQWDAPTPLPLEGRSDEIVALGRVTPSKRLDQSIRALSLLTDPPYDRLRLRIIGGGSTEVRADLDRLAAELGVSDRVTWTGFVDEAEKRTLLARAKAIVMTSVREGWGLAVTEANLAGTPAVGYRILGLKDSIKNGETGYTIEESPSALAQALRNLLSNPTRYSELSHAAQVDARSLTWEGTASYVDRFLKGIVNGQ